MPEGGEGATFNLDEMMKSQGIDDYIEFDEEVENLDL
jgi:hypothetical protein